MDELIILSKARKIGGSLVVTIPIQIVKDEQICENDEVEIKVKKRKKDYFGVLKGIGSFKEKDRAIGQLEK